MRRTRARRGWSGPFFLGACSIVGACSPSGSFGTGPLPDVTAATDSTVSDAPDARADDDAAAVPTDACVPAFREDDLTPCSDGLDNDCDGRADCLDFACSRSSTVTVCRTGGMPICSPCRTGSECSGGVCPVYTDQPALRFCSRRCTTDADCAGTTLTRCSGGLCVTQSYTYACAAGGGSYTVRDACGLVRTYPCTSPERCRMVGARAECASPASCHGTPTACSARSSTLCGRDCSSSGRCGGSARSCGSYLSSSACRQQDGCNWSGSLSNECRGSANSCSSFSSEYSCSSQNGCSWRVTCSGTPQPCASFTTSTACAGQPGCQWN